MTGTEWQLLTTLTDLPSAQSLAQALIDAGMDARVSSDAGVLGQAAPSRIYVSRGDYRQAREFLGAGESAPEP
ncbi:MAG TPA: hypothetical protein VL994_12945 [Steroidobacteraceae bacterium]|nr:hypothetical protein [Steroidobacteraceae bacterium]HUA90338.1 hypothetical protein [Steroidobacteraceae bacterium]